MAIASTTNVRNSFMSVVLCCVYSRKVQRYWYLTAIFIPENEIKRLPDQYLHPTADCKSHVTKKAIKYLVIMFTLL
jgi:hypothetical protein